MAVVDVAVKNGAWVSPVERIVSLAVLDGPIIVELAVALVIFEPKADERHADAMLL